MPAPRKIQIDAEHAGLNAALDALANGSAQAIIADAFEANYPVSYDPSTGVLADAQVN